MDLVLLGRRGRMACVEVKLSSAPSVTKGFHHARTDLGPEITLVVAPVAEPYGIGAGVQVLGLDAALETLADW